MPPRRGQARQPCATPRPRAGPRGDRHRPHALGDARPADRDQRPPDRHRPRRRCPQRHHREFPGFAARARRAGLCVPDRHRYRGGGEPGDAFSREGPVAARRGGQDPGAAGGRVCAGVSVCRRARPADRRPPWQSARDRLWRRRDVSGLRCAGARAVDPPHHLSRRGRLGDRNVAHSDGLRRRQYQGYPADPRIRRLGRADRQRQLPPLRAEGDLRAAGGHWRHAQRSDQPGGAHRPSARAALYARGTRPRDDDRLRHRLPCLRRREVLVRTHCPHLGRNRHRLRVPLPGAGDADIVLPTLAGPEIGVASTKAFTTQLAVLACFTVTLARASGAIGHAREAELVGVMTEVPSRASEVLNHDERIREIAAEIALARDVLYLGRGSAYPLALEGALKLKEISYIHAEGYAAGEMKHGPIALIDENVPVIVLAPHDELFEKTLGNVEEVMARGGRVVMISDSAGVARLADRLAFGIAVPSCDPFVAPILYAIPIQLLAYHTAVLKGTDVDQPRNLAKSVTVE